MTMTYVSKCCFLSMYKSSNDFGLGFELLFGEHTKLYKVQFFTVLEIGLPC